MRTTEQVFDDRLPYARTLPAEWYNEPAILEAEKQRIFSRTWQLVGRTEQVASPGDYFTTLVADEPVIVVRGNDGRVRAFSSVCRHRAGPVATGQGTRKVFQCGYHGWTYGLDGCLRTTPEFEGVECFEREANNLPQFKVAAWDALLFINLDASGLPLVDVLEDLPSRFETRSLIGLKLAARKQWDINCNWKVYVDNYLEGYHIPMIHPSLSREISYADYRVETRHYYSIQHSPIKQVESPRLRREASAANNDAEYFWIFPNLMLNVYPDNYSTNLILPLGPERTRTIFEWYFRDPESESVQEIVRRTVEFSEEVQLEDIGICEAVQVGLRSRFYDRGRYSVKRENGVHHFHGLLAGFMNASTVNQGEAEEKVAAVRPSRVE
jgi:choline monooxygenase